MSAAPSPPSTSVISLASVEIVLSAIFIPLVVFIAWKHGKAGMACCQIYIMAFVAKLIANIYLIVNKDKPLTGSVLSTIMDSTVVATVSLGIIGIIYEANIILPEQPNKWTDKIILGVTHVAITVGVGIATYGGSPSGTGVANESLSRIGNLLIFFVVFSVFIWIWPTYKKIAYYRRSGSHPNARAALVLLWGGAAAMPIWLARLVYMCVYAFNRQDTGLDPTMGSFGVKILLFVTLWGASAALTAGGWFALASKPSGGFLKARDGGSFTDAEYEAPLSRRQSGPEVVEMYEHVARPKC